MTDRLVCYSGGKFTEPYHDDDSEWYKAASVSDTAERDELLNKAGCQLYIKELTGFGAAKVKVWVTPDDRLLVFLMNKKTDVASVLIIRQSDWLPFYVKYVVPFIQAHASIQINSHLASIQNDIRNMRSS